jgi:hypothetical protein
MNSKLMPLVVCCLLFSVCVGQWSSPAALLGGSPDADGLSLAAGSGDTVWATVVSTAPCRVYACWTTGDTWSQPVELGPPDSNPVFHDPGTGRDASGHMWAAWYKDLDSGGVWAAFRDSSGWHASRVYYSGPAAGPMSFAADAAGDWYLGFATLTPYSDYAYSSAVSSRWTGDSWESPRYIARGASDPFETDYYAPKLVTRPDSGLWAVYEMSLGSSSRISRMRIVQRDTVRGRWIANGTDPVATADSAGRLWILYSELAQHWVTSQMIVDSVGVDTQLITDVAEGPACVTCAGGHVDGLVWMLWPHYTSHRVMANYAFETEWFASGQVSDSEGVPKGIAAANERVYAAFRTPDGRLYSVYRKSTPAIHQQPGPVTTVSCHPSVVRGVLLLPWDMTEAAEVSDRVPRSLLLDASGRKVLDLHAGPNDVRALAPGVYFIREAQAQAQAVRKVVITK